MQLALALQTGQNVASNRRKTNSPVRKTPRSLFKVKMTRYRYVSLLKTSSHYQYQYQVAGMATDISYTFCTTNGIHQDHRARISTLDHTNPISMADPAASLSDYRAVVALNNKGVTLLERRCHRDAMETFKDALDLMRAISPESQKRREMSVTERNECLKKASMYAARSTPRTSGADDSEAAVTAVSSTAGSPPVSFYLTVLAHDHHSTEALSAALHEIPSGASGSVLLIEFDEDDINLNIDLSVLLHNYSMSCRMKSLTTKNTEKSHHLIERAYKFAHVANKVLSQENNFLEDDYQLERTLVLSMLVLQHLVLLSSQRGENDEARKYYGELGQLRASFLEAEDGLPTASPRKIASAA